MLSEKYKCGLYGDGNFLESSLDNGHFITGMHPGGRNHPYGTEKQDRDADKFKFADAEQRR